MPNSKCFIFFVVGGFEVFLLLVSVLLHIIDIYSLLNVKASRSTCWENYIHLLLHWYSQTVFLPDMHGNCCPTIKQFMQAVCNHRYHWIAPRAERMGMRNSGARPSCFQQRLRLPRLLHWKFVWLRWSMGFGRWPSKPDDIALLVTRLLSGNLYYKFSFLFLN